MIRILSICSGLLFALLVMACEPGSESTVGDGAGSGGMIGAGRFNVGMKMPAFALPAALDGSNVDSRDYAGKVLLITFFSTR